MEKMLKSLGDREREINDHKRAADVITADERLLNANVPEGAVNYILGQSAGFVAGFKAAMDDIIECLANEYREIPIGESELYMLTELGKLEERAWLKDYKQVQIIEKAGWKYSFKHCMWERGSEDECTP